MSESTSDWVVELAEIGEGELPRVGGKGVNLGILAAAGLPVPEGFCVTTAAFGRFMAQDPGLAAALDELDRLDPDDVDGVRTQAGRLRERLRGLPVPPEVDEAVRRAWQHAGPAHAYAVRSSATLEDLPQASFAGQQDTHLQVRGAAAVVERVRDCWASLFTDRAVLYRRQHGFPSRAARLAVVVQRMVASDVSGVLFTADPLTGHRGVCSIDASYGLGEALVSGLVEPDLYRLDKATGALLEARVGAKAQAIVAKPGEAGGTVTRDVPPADRARRCLGDDELAALVELARAVEARQGCPQDLEWGIEAGRLWLLQARAITSLFPIPAPASSDGGLRVYLSFGHVQVNTAPMPPMAHDVVRWVVPFGKRQARAPSMLVASAGGRIYLDFTPALLRWPIARLLPAALMNVDPGIARRLMVVRDRPAFREGGAHRAADRRPLAWAMRRIVPSLVRRMLARHPERAREEFTELVERLRESFARRYAAAAPGAARLREASSLLGDFFYGPILPMQLPLIIGGMVSWGLLRRLVNGLVPEATVRALSRGLPGNVTTDMDLELGDLADRAREVPGLVERLRREPPGRAALDAARELPGSEAFFAEWERFMARYGQRAPGEIDVSTPRWCDDPASLVASLVGITSDEPGAHRRRHRAAVREAEAAMAAIEAAAGRGLWGGLRRPLARALARRVRAFLGLREHGKYVMTLILVHVRRAVLEAAELAVARGQLERAEDGFMLRLDELAAAAEGQGDGAARRAEVARRREELRRHARLVPPRVITSEGEQPPLPDEVGPLPPGELAGHAASAGVVEGVARVVLDPAKEVLEAGEILVAPFTDPGWTPLFVHAKGLVMEVGGLMTHGSVVAREYGLPAVVGVDGATRRIRTGQRLRVDGDRGRVVLLDGRLDERGEAAAPEASVARGAHA